MERGACLTCLSINGYFAQSLRYVRKLILGISTICLWLIFSQVLILNKISHFWTDTNFNILLLLSKMSSIQWIDQILLLT